LWLPRKDAMDTVYDTLKPAIRYAREECVDLPPTTFVEHHADLSAKQAKSYGTMLKTLKAEVNEGEVTAANEAVKLGKLVQIACGVVYDSHNQIPHELGAPSREDLACDLVRGAAGKAIVFVPFVAVIQRVATVLQNAGFSVGIVHGGVSSRERNDIFQRFQRTNDLDVIVAQPAAMSHGLTLTAASTIVWYAPITSSDTYEQANARITRPGQAHNTLIANISGTPEERRIYDRLKKRQKVQNILLDKVVASRAA
ncbi:MAG: SWF/SNF helicase family protein, partial [Anaerolineae bacterium]|nr:SWF/SNF helicase family protein [Anaerolineae bacterium]